ncbi:hypothetical protein C4580_06200 [Candidatus Woesearchaeota archaeon]|nr:MAG: hypothetical protein C4580_06200 [Candidatus Woesearchaeota archaeon]
MDPTLFAALLGGIGGAARGLVGLAKALTQKRRLIWSYWLLTVFIAIVIGGATGIVFNFEPRLSVLAGYAGTDLLEGIYKSFKAQKVLVTK